MGEAIFALIGVIVGTLLTRLGDVKFTGLLRKRTKNNLTEDDGKKDGKLSVYEQWENLLCYDGDEKR